MATAHLVCGYIGAGKTTYALELERRHRAVRFTTDEWLAELYGADERDYDVQAAFPRVEQVMLPLWTRLLREGVDVVLDQGLWTRERRDAVRRTAVESGAEARLYYLRCSEETGWERVERRNEDPRLSIRIARTSYEALRVGFEPPGADEAHVLVET